MTLQICHQQEVRVHGEGGGASAELHLLFAAFGEQDELPPRGQAQQLASGDDADLLERAATSLMTFVATPGSDQVVEVTRNEDFTAK